MKTVLITGSSRGIGRETAIYFAQQGWNVIIHGFRHPEKLESLKNEILEENVSCLSFCGDISDPSFVDEMIKQSLLTFSKIDCLVNNGGISLVGHAANVSPPREQENHPDHHGRRTRLHPCRTGGV